ncbi:MAG: hypothetical protein COA73_05720 [Candidatus Hydrogenedentota bacterium]|nr:MAG: hypothetical protein COA73_05720 [Candidatus Hydrogenedentota bacterium]
MSGLEEVQNLSAFEWFSEPKEFSLITGTLSMRTEAETDFWQRTHYSIQRDNGHCFLKTISGDFTISTHTSFSPEAQYDQCGLFARVDSENWIKCSSEFEHSSLSRLGTVVTNLGYSDWSSQDITTPLSSIWFRLSREGNDFLIEQSSDGESWEQMRVTHLHQVKDALKVGVYACSPVGNGFRCSFNHIELNSNARSKKEM